ncbi:MAG: hypothetical protein DSY80_07125 [Desulfocapsa sp.]|nr:MAG: hypothetical protein DSY80_07125 [Desulfocapsa sp.]
MTKKELLIRARDLEVKGCSRMNKAQLIIAIKAKANTETKTTEQFTQTILTILNEEKTPLTTGGHFNGKVAIAQAHHAYGEQRISLREFKQNLLRLAATQTQWRLARLDTASLMNAKMRRMSETCQFGDEFHFIAIN